MFDLTKELKEKLLTAKNIEALKELLQMAGLEINGDELGQLWNEVSRVHVDKEKEYSVDELEAVSGGKSLWFSGDRDWLEDGCEATVEPGSWCGSNDRCHAFEISYEHRPVRYCSKCGGISYKIHPYGGNEKATWSRCNVCGYEEW